MAVRTWKKEWEEGLRWKKMLVVGGELLSLSSIAKGKNKKGLIGLSSLSVDAWMHSSFLITKLFCSLFCKMWK